MAKPVPPPALIYDCGVDTELLLRGKLESRCREDAHTRVIVRLKSGATHIGRIYYFDSSRLTLAQDNREPRLRDVNYRDIARILATPKRA